MRIYINMRTVFSVLIVLFFVLTFNVTTSDAQDSPVYMYWAEESPCKILRANLGGSNVQDLVFGTCARGIALDVAEGKIYWTEVLSDRGKVLRANLDGSNIQTLADLGPRSRAADIALDVAERKIYWTSGFHTTLQRIAMNKIQRANLDGTNIEDLIIIETTGSRAGDFSAIDLDVVGRKMYYGNNTRIQRANLDGTNIEDLHLTDYGTTDIDLDIDGGRLYWVDGGIHSVNLDGQDSRTHINVEGDLSGMALDIAQGKIYWTNRERDKIQRANLDGTNIEDLVTIGVRFPLDIALGIPQPIGGLRFNPDVIPDQTFTVGTPVNLTLPSATGGTAPYTYTLSPIPAGLQFDTATQLLSGTPTIVGTTAATYTATDAVGTSASLTFSIEVIEDGTGPGTEPLDVNGDGQVTVVDLAIVALFYGTQVPVGVNLPADVNADGVVNLLDLTAVAQGIDAAGGANGISLQELEAALLAGEIEVVAGAPMGFGRHQHVLSLSIRYGNVAAALADVRQMTVGDVRLGKGMAVLEGLLQLLAEMVTIPDQTILLPNYPNPFNPETWMPYHLAKDAEVILRIYDMRGVSVRELVLGHQAAGIYQSKSRAAYWDGRNDSGELVASGVYFYTLTAGDFTATRKLLIWK